jgi:2-oxoisovalerate dehydrogenase E1 component
VRQELSPYALILHTHRFGPHSKGDDTRDPQAIEQMKSEHDPIKIHGNRLQIDQKTSIERQVDDEIKAAFENASNDPFPPKLG